MALYILLRLVLILSRILYREKTIMGRNEYEEPYFFLYEAMPPSINLGNHDCEGFSSLPIS